MVNTTFRLSAEKRADLQKKAAFLSEKEGRRVTLSDVFRLESAIGSAVINFEIEGPTMQNCMELFTSPALKAAAAAMVFFQNNKGAQYHEN